MSVAIASPAKAPQHASRPALRVWTGALSLFLLGIVHRLVQLWVLWPPLARQIANQAGQQDMTLLPAAIMRDHPWWGLWYLEQTPPIPTAIFGLVLAGSNTPVGIGICLIVFQAVLSSATAVVMALLLKRLGFRWTISLILSALLLLSTDLLVIEYQTIGQKFYNTLAMLILTLSGHAALSLARRPTRTPALALGICVGLLAVTRASFAFFWPIALIWVLAVGTWRRPLILAAFMLPICLIQGGWSLKNDLALGYWSLSTSSWGGANLLHAEHWRHGSTEFYEWRIGHPPICERPWQELTVNPPPTKFFFLPVDWPPGSLPQPVVDKDALIEARRGHPAPLDSFAVAQWSRCLMSQFAAYWEHRPLLAVKEAWQSYMLYWQPIRQFTVFFPLIKPDMPIYSQKLNWWRGVRDSLRELGGRGFLLQWVPKPEAFKASDFVPVRLLAFPVIPSLIASLNFVLLHSLPFVLVLRLIRGRGAGWPAGFGFLILAYLYQASASSLGEYGENMRYRIEAEPIIWVISFVTLCFWIDAFRRRQEA